MPRDHNFNCSHGETAPFFDPENWKVDSNLNLNTPLIEIGVNIHIFQDDTGGNNFSSSSDMVRLQQIFDWAAQKIGHPDPPSNPVTSVCGSNCHVTDTRVRLVLKRIETLTGKAAIGKTYQGQQLIDTRNYPPGTYLYQIIQEGDIVLTGKFIINK